LAVAARTNAAPVVPGALRFFFEGGSANVFARATDVDPELWRVTFATGHKNLEYYQLIEETLGIGFTYRYLVLFDLDERAIALQPLILVDQDLATSINGRIGRTIKFVRSRVPRFMQARMLMAGCLVGEGKLGLISDVDPNFASELLARALRLFARAEDVSMIAIKDFPVRLRKELDPLTRGGYTRIDGFPSLYLDLDFASVEDYMRQRLTRVTRKGLRRKLKKTAAVVPPIRLEVLTDCSGVIDEIYPLYLNVVQRSEVKFEVFTKEYFLEAGRRMPGRFRYFIWRRAGKAVAFCFCTIWDNTIYDNDIGLDYNAAYDLNLYYLTFHDILDWALKHRLQVYETAPFNYDAKLHLRLQLIPLDLYVRHTNPLLNLMLKFIAPLFAPARSDQALRKYFHTHNSA
jgi:hypothetical protein